MKLTLEQLYEVLGNCAVAVGSEMPVCYSMEQSDDGIELFDHAGYPALTLTRGQIEGGEFTDGYFKYPAVGLADGGRLLLMRTAPATESDIAEMTGGKTIKSVTFTVVTSVSNCIESIDFFDNRHDAEKFYQQKAEDLSKCFDDIALFEGDTRIAAGIDAFLEDPT